MSFNSFGHSFRFTTWGESHGPAIGVVVDGVPPRIPLTEGQVQERLDRRRPGQSRFTTQRQEADQIKILSGVFDGLTTGTPIGMVIENTDQRSRDYGEILDRYRPGMPIMPIRPNMASATTAAAAARPPAKRRCASQPVPWPKRC